jgi:hypothetical protein
MCYRRYIEESEVIRHIPTDDQIDHDAKAGIMMALANDTAYQTIASLLFPAEKRQG